MTKLKVVLLVGGAAVAAGYVFRKQLRLPELAQQVREFKRDLIEQLHYQESNRDFLRSSAHDDVDEFLAHPETGTVFSGRPTTD